MTEPDPAGSRPSPSSSPSCPRAEASPGAPPEAGAPSQPRLLERVRAAIRARHYSTRTEKAYVAWIRRYIVFNQMRHPDQMGAAEVTCFLSHLATQGKVSASTQNQALSALLFLYRDLLRRELAGLEEVVRAKGPVRLPLVLSRDEVTAILRRLQGAPRLMASLMYGAGLRLLECCRLRVKDVDFARAEITARAGSQRWVRQRGVAGRLAAQVPARGLGGGLAMGVSRHAPLPRPAERSEAAPPPSRVGRAAGVQGRRAHRQRGEASELPLAPPLLRNPPSRVGLRHPNDPGAARPPGRRDHHGLHSRPQSWWAGRPQPIRRPGVRLTCRRGWPR